MAKPVSLIVLLLFPLLLFIPMELHALSWDVVTDVMSLDFLWMPGARVSLEAGVRINDMRFSVPFHYSWNLHADISFLDTGLRIDCYPFDGWGLFFGVDAFRWGRWFGWGSPEKRDVFLSALYAGWTLSWPYFTFEPRIVFTDPSRTSEIELEPLREHFFMYGSVYAQIMMGVSFR